jgi:colanic acid/amylovoran biosynthesis glycosyltransferase
MQPDRVAYLAGRYVTPSHTFIVREVRALRELGIDVHPFSIWRSAPEQLLTDADRAEAARTFDILPLRPAEVLRSAVAAVRLLPRALRLAPPGLRGRMLGVSWAIEASILRRQMRRRGIRHVHAHLAGTGPAVAMLASEHTWSLTVHGPHEFYEVEKEALAAKVRSADFVVCISDFGRSQLMAFVEEEHWAKLHVVHCGLDAGAYPEPERKAGGTEVLNLLAVGRLTQNKGQAVLLEALAELRARNVDARLTIVGDGPKREELEGLARRLGLAEAVHFAGALGQDRVTDLYEAADIFVHASFAEGLPVVLMEAMAHRLPVVATNVMGTGELVRSGESGVLVPPGRPDELARAIEVLAGDSDARRRLAEAGRRTVEADFDIHASAERMRDLFARYAA